MSKPLTPDTESVVGELRRYKDAVDLLFTAAGEHRPELAYVLGRAISRLCLLDVHFARSIEMVHSAVDAPAGAQIVRAASDPDRANYVVDRIEHLRQSVAEAQQRYVRDHQRITELEQELAHAHERWAEHRKAAEQALRDENAKWLNVAREAREAQGKAEDALQALRDGLREKEATWFSQARVLRATGGNAARADTLESCARDVHALLSRPDALLTAPAAPSEDARDRLEAARARAFALHIPNADAIHPPAAPAATPMVNPCVCGHEKGDHQQRIGQRGNYTPCCADGCKCDGFRKAPSAPAGPQERTEADRGRDGKAGEPTP